MEARPEWDLRKMRELRFVVLLLVISLPCFSASDRQGDALYDMKQKLNVTGGQLSDWNQNQVNPCTWNSVICDNNNNVIQVTLAARGFTGVLSPRIGELQNLSVLSLAGNRITGTIPEEFGNLSSLTSLDLEDNLLVGEVPASLGNLSKLQLLILSQNNFNGSIPGSIANISSLTDIRLAYNNLSGQIPGLLFQVARYNFSGNHLNCGPNFPHYCASNTSYPSGSHNSKIGLILGTVGGILGLIIVGALFLICNARRKSHLREVFVDVAGSVPL
ncbi:putative LRR receptor-like serine/threonine-protein kinase [Zea mays]|uniref:Putative LRR receptor-like serine/threonine-protein kinase n=1 Tax=Zea mays TaxID=4577 RepID=A0A1D6H4T1_MAIZE|nr:putative LRR receptor-like serine/threonine-protein kinase [Zea mays]